MENNGWSFCVITALGNEKLLKGLINSILTEFKGKNFEIIIVGNTKISNQYSQDFIKFFNFEEEIFFFKFNNIKKAIKEFSLKRLFFKTGAICHKKNLAAKYSRFNKLCMMHDYVALQPGWKDGWDEYGDNWNVAMNIIQNMDGSRHRDWLNLDYPGVSLGNKIWEGSCLMPYEKVTKYMYIPGMYFCVKRDFFLQNLLNEKLFHCEGEDVEWSLRIREKTEFQMNTQAIVRYLKYKPVDWTLWNENEARLLKLI